MAYSDFTLAELKQRFHLTVEETSNLFADVGEAVLPPVLADLLARTPVIVAARHSDVWLGGAGLLMTAIAAAAVIARPKRTFLWLGIDSIALVVVYAGVIALLPHVT